MATYTWIGNKGTSDPNDATQAANWSLNGTPGVGTPGSGDIAVVGVGATLDVIANSGTVDDLTIQAAGTDTFNFTDVNDVVSSITLGTDTVLNLSGTSLGLEGFDIGYDGQGHSEIYQTGADGTLSINTLGSIDDNGFLWLEAAGGTATINIAADVISPATVPGDFYEHSAILNLGESLTITASSLNSSNRFSNAGYILVASESAVASVTLDARMDGTSGEFGLLGDGKGATLDIATNMGGGQFISFMDGDATVVIQATTTLGSYANVSGTPVTVLQDSFERFVDFNPGDTIDLAGIAVANVTYSFGGSTSFGGNVLKVLNNGTVIALLRMSSGTVFATGTGDFATSTYTSNFRLSSDGSGGTDITVSATPVAEVVGVATIDVGGQSAELDAPSSGGTIDWGNGANWSDGTDGFAGGIPSQYQAVQITNSLAELASFADYTLTVSSAETAGGLTMDDHFLTLDITASLTLSQAPNETSGGGLVELSGTLIVAAGATLAASNLYNVDGDTTIGVGAVVTLPGITPFSLGNGLTSVDDEKDIEIDGGTLNAGGSVVLGDNGSATLNVQASGSVGASVSANYTVVGAESANDANNPNGLTNSTLEITGTNTIYRDVGTDSTSPYAGAMIVGGGGVSINALDTVDVPGSGTGSLEVANGASLVDSGYAIVGMFGGGYGSVSISDASWSIGVTNPIVLPGSVEIGSGTIYTVTPPLLTVGLVGVGTLDISNGGVLTLGTEAGSTSEYNLAIGEGGPSVSTYGTGEVTVDGGTINSINGPIAVGYRAYGSLNIIDGGTVESGTGGGITAFGLIVGDKTGVVAGTTMLGTGIVTVGNGSGTLSLLSDSGNFVDGYNGDGSVYVNAAGSISIGGVLDVGGYNSGGEGTGAGVFLVQGGTATIGIAATLYSGNTLEVSGGAIAIGGVAVTGNINVGVGDNLSVFNTFTTDPVAQIVDAAGGALNVLGTLAVGSTATLNVNAAVSGNGLISISTTSLLQLDQEVVSGTTITMGGTATGGTLELEDPNDFFGDVANFWNHASGPNNVLLLDGIGTTDISVLWTQVNAQYGTLDVATQTRSEAIQISGYHPNGFSVVADTANNGVMITADDTSPCFATGSRIATRDGDVAVEALQVGQEVRLADGGWAPVVWIGHRRVACARNPRPQDVMPVRVCAHAFGPGQPYSDLLLSPDHAVFADGVLIPVRYLLNGVTIRQESVQRITYWHVELPEHAVLLAQGLACESYLDTGNRSSFANGGGGVMLHPAFARRVWDERACAPLVTSGGVRAAVRERLRRQAEQLGHCLADDPALVVFAGERMIAADAVDGRVRFELPACETVRLVSRCDLPAHSSPASDDMRLLGVGVGALWLDGHGLALDGADLGEGWHQPEPGLRWTNGYAELVTSGARVLEVEVAMTASYWLPDVLPPVREAVA